MTPRTEIDWIDLDASEATLQAQILEQGHSRFLLGRGSLDNFVGVALAKDLRRDLLQDGKVNLARSLRQPLVVHESVPALGLIEQLRRSRVQMAVIVDEFGSLEGIATSTDILEAIAGEFPGEDEDLIVTEQAADGSWLVDGWIDIRRAPNLLEVDIEDETDRCSTLAGYILCQLGHLPAEGDKVQAGGLEFEVVALLGRTINKV